MKYPVGTNIEVIAFPDHPEFIGLRGTIVRVDTREYLVALEDGSDQGMRAFVKEHEVKVMSTLKHAIGRLVEIVNHKDYPAINGHIGMIFEKDHTAYAVTIEKFGRSFICSEDEVKLPEQKLTSPMEAYGRILLPLLHSSMDAPKTVYYSSTTGSVYMMDKMMDNALYFDVCIVRMLWDRELGGKNPNMLATEVFRLKQPRDMSATLDAFKEFVMAHINSRPADYADLLWKED